MIKLIAEWLNKKDEELDEAIINDENNVKVYTKAFGLGFIEGVADGLFILGCVTWITSVVKSVMKLFKK